MKKIVIQDCSTLKKYYADIISTTTAFSLINTLIENEHVEKHNKNDSCFGYKLVQGKTGKSIPKSENITNYCDNDDTLYLMVDTSVANTSQISMGLKIGIYIVGIALYFLINLILGYFLGIKTGYLINLILLFTVPRAIIKKIEKNCYTKQLERGEINKYIPIVKNNTEFIKVMNAISEATEKEWILIEENGNYSFACKTNSGDISVVLPNGKPLKTKYKSLADRILKDLQTYGYDYTLSESVVSYHVTLNDRLNELKRKEIVAKLYDSLIQDDWTFIQKPNHINQNEISCDKSIRMLEIRKWLEKCSKMQLAAVCCLGNAYKSLNVPFCIANMMESYDTSNAVPVEEVEKLANLVAQIGEYDEKDTYNDLNAFVFYYGIHYNEKGKIIEESNENEDGEKGVLTEENADVIFNENEFEKDCVDNITESEFDCKNHSDRIIQSENINCGDEENIIAGNEAGVNEKNKAIEGHKFVSIEQKVNTPHFKIMFCRKCGARLIEDSLFCNKCGTKVINPEE